MNKLLITGLLLFTPSAFAAEIPELTDQLRDEIRMLADGMNQIDPETGKSYGALLGERTEAGDYSFESFRIRILGKVKFGAFGFGFAVKPHIQLGWKI
jgi:hypothetical protein